MSVAAKSARPQEYATVLLVVGAAIGMLAGFAVLFSSTFSIFVKPISADFGWGRSEVSLLTTTAFLGFALGSPIIGMLFDRHGSGRVLAIAIAIFAAGLSAFALMPQNLALFIAVAFVVGLTSAATSSSGYVLILSKWFDKRLGLAIGCAMIGLGTGMVFAPIMAQALISEIGWRDTYLVFAVFSLIGGAIALLLGVGRPPPQARRAAAGDGATDLPYRPGSSLAEALRSWRFWVLGVTALLVSIAAFGWSAHIAAAMSDRGMTAIAASRLVGILGIGIMTGRIAAALLMDKVFAPWVAFGCYLLGALGLLSVASASPDQLMLLTASAFFTGLVGGSEGDIVPFMTRRYFGSVAFGSIFGCLVGMAGVGGLLGPFIFGLFYDLTGSYGTILAISAGLCVASGIALLSLGPYPYPAVETEAGR